MRATLNLCFLLGAIFAIVSSTTKAQSPCFNHSGHEAIDDQAFAKGEMLNAKDRFQFWFAHLGDAQAQERGKTEWQIHIDWSIQDHGPVENEIQKTWWNGLPVSIWAECICPPGEGRKTAMKIAIDRAKAGDCKSAALITVSTQLHNPEALDTFHHTDANEFCKYLKSK
jgi:hypothetical protein